MYDKNRKGSTYNVVNDVRVRGIGHSTVKGLKITEAASSSRQSGFRRLVHQALNSIEKAGLLFRSQMTPLLTDCHLLFAAAAGEVLGDELADGFTFVDVGRHFWESSSRDTDCQSQCRADD